jgi:hypothetical protein
MGYWRKAFDGLGWQEFLEKMAAEESVEAQLRRTTAAGYLLWSDATAI